MPYKTREDRLAYQREYYRKNPEKYKVYFSKRKPLSEKSKAKIKRNREQYRIDNRDEILARARVRYHKNKKKYADKWHVWYLENKDKRKVYRLEYQRTHQEWLAEKQRRYRINYRENWVTYLRKRRYGITKDQFDEMFDAQGGRCAICFTQLEKFGKQTHVDHCHKTGIIRGILCRPCNCAVGFIRDDPKIAFSMSEYLGNNGVF